jgi:hypothetical protein
MNSGNIKTPPYLGGGGREKSRRVNMMQIIYTHICKCKKWYLLKQLQESGEGGWKRTVDGVSLSMICSIHSKNLLKCYNVPPPSTTIIIKKLIKRIADFRCTQYPMDLPGIYWTSHPKTALLHLSHQHMEYSA